MVAAVAQISGRAAEAAAQPGGVGHLLLAGGAAALWFGPVVDSRRRRSSAPLCLLADDRVSGQRAGTAADNEFPGVAALSAPAESADAEGDRRRLAADRCS